MPDPEPGTTFQYRQDLIDAELHSSPAGAICYRGHPVQHVYTVLSNGGGYHKNVGGLLQQSGRDFLLYQAGSTKLKADVLAFHANMEAGLPVRVICKVLKENSASSSDYLYLYCGKYDVRQACASCHDRSALLSLLPSRQLRHCYHLTQPDRAC